MDGEPLFLIQDKRGVFEVELTLGCPNRSLEWFRRLGFRRRPRGLRISGTGGQHRGGQYRYIDLLHNSSPTTRSSSMDASFTPAWRSSRRRLDRRLTRRESSSSSMPISPS